MQRILKIVAGSLGLLTILVFLVVWRNFFFYARVRKAYVTLDGQLCGSCAIYLARGGAGGVLARRDAQSVQVYSLAFPNPNYDVPNGAVWKCVDGAFSFALGFAFHHMYQPCVPRGLAPAQKQLQMNSRFVEFTADDGKRVRAKW
jgi:hypothetical protein